MRAELLLARIPVVMTAASVVYRAVRQDMLILMNRLRAGRWDTLKTVRITATIAPKANCTSAKKTRARAMTSVRLTAVWTTAITATAAV